jgi:hypothetical protein
VVIIHGVTKKLGRVLPHPSAIFHMYALVDTPWVRYHPTHPHTKLLSLGIPYILYASVHFKCLFIRIQPTQALIDTGGGYHFGALNFQSRPLSTFPSSILHFPLIAPPSLHLYQPFDHHAKPHRTSIDRKGAIVSGFQPLVFYQ